MSGSGELHKFIFEGLPVRGALLRLSGAWQEVLQRRADAGDAFALPVRQLLGEMAAAAVLMQSSIRFNGDLVLQMVGDGPVKLAVAEVRSDFAFRATAKVVGEVADDARLQALLNVHGGGRCAITLDPKDKFPGQQPYQSSVALHGDRREPLQQLSEVLEHYMLQSQQLDTKLVLAADDHQAAGLLIQRMPVEGAGNLGGARNEDRIGQDEDYRRIALLAGTLTRDELLTFDADAVLRRLFWEEKLRRFAPATGADGPRFECRCSRERVGRMLEGLGRAEVDGIVVEQGRVEIACDFCGRKYHFDPVDVGELFTPRPNQMPGSGAIN
ncbi:MAG: Hsp33 family molecular chaperone HslO [Burkholderiaceae bacterium]